MRRKERHHLKENPLAVWIGELSASLSDRGGAVAIGLVILGVGLVATAGYLSWQGRQLEAAGDRLGQALAVLEAQVVPPGSPDTDDEALAPDDAAAPGAPGGAFQQPPGTYPSVDTKFEAALPLLLDAADAFPAAAPGVTARYHAATVLVGLGRSAEAAAQYQQIIETVDDDDLYGALSVLGLAEAYVASANYEEAIRLLEGATAAVETVVPLDAVLMQLGRAHRLSGAPGNALSAFTRVVEEFPTSVYYSDAQRQVDTLQSENPTASGN
jgi:tetratricopeptide (TPR) repeat protein